MVYHVGIFGLWPTWRIAYCITQKHFSVAAHARSTTFCTPLRVHAAAPARFTHRLSILTLVWLRTGRILRRFVPILTWERSRGNGWEKATVQNDLLVAISQHLWAADIPGRSTDEPTRDDVLSQVQSQSVAVCSAPRARTLHAEKHARRPDDFSLACSCFACCLGCENIEEPETEFPGPRRP